MKLYVDDIRQYPEGWIPARTITEAIRALATMPIEVVSLDHDICWESPLGHQHSSCETFEPVARYIALMLQTGSKIQVEIHTANFPAGTKMAEIIGIDYRWPETKPDTIG